MGGAVCSLLTVWLSSSFLSAGLSVWEAAFLLTQGKEDTNQLLHVFLPVQMPSLCRTQLCPQSVLTRFVRRRQLVEHPSGLWQRRPSVLVPWPWTQTVLAEDEDGGT